MKIEKGVAVNVEGVSDIVRQAVVKKFEGLGFASSPWSRDKGKYLGLDGEESAIVSYSGGCINAEEHTLITLAELMFCDQPDDVTHCYCDGENITYNSGDPYAGRLICTREAKDSRSWYEKGELPPIGEKVELNLKPFDYIKESGIFFNDKYGIIKYISEGGFVFEDSVGEDCFVDAIDYLYELRPIKSERERLICDLYFEVTGEQLQGNEMDDDDWISFCESAIDAGWRPTND